MVDEGKDGLSRNKTVWEPIPWSAEVEEKKIKITHDEEYYYASHTGFCVLHGLLW